MLRVLLVLEDYGELMFLQTILKKIGMDVDSTQNPRMVGDLMLSLNPDVVVLTAIGKRIKGLELVTSGHVKRTRGAPKVVLIRSGQMQKDVVGDTPIDAWLDSPVAAPDLLAKIAELCGLSNQTLQDKLLKLRMSDPEADPSRILKMQTEAEAVELARSNEPDSNFGSLKPSTMSSHERQSRYKKFLSEPAPRQHGFALKEVQEQVKALRKEESEVDGEELERQRRAFVEHLFKKKVS